MNPPLLPTQCAAFGKQMLRASIPVLSLALLLVSGGTASAIVGGTLTPNTLSSSSTTPLVLQLTGLATGASVTVQRFVDANPNGTIDAGEFLAESFTVTDGQLPVIGGVRNIHMPGDEDGAADGEIEIHLTPSLQAELGRLAGAQLVKISSPSAAFTPFNLSLTITQPAQAQSISGTVKNGITPVPYAAVALLDAIADEFVLGVVADEDGEFTVNAPAGSYILLPVKSGYVAGFTDPFVLSAGTTPTLDLQITPATSSISGTIADAGNNAGLGGVQLFIGSSELATLTSTNADGTYSAPVTADLWEIEISDISINRLGYLSEQNGLSPMADTTTAAATGIDVGLTKATALIYGTVTGTGAIPLAGLRMGANVANLTYNGDATTDANGHYLMGVVAGTWQTYVSNDSPGLAGYVIPQGQNVEISSGQAQQVNFALSSVTAHLQGVVLNLSNMSSPVPGIQVGAYNQSTNQYVAAVTAANGTFDLGVVAGTWMLQIESSSAASFGVVGGSVERTVADNETISGITIGVQSATAQISGYVRDSGSQPINANVYANATIGDVNYSANTQTDGSGNYSLPVINGNWQVGANANGYTNPSNVPTVVSGSNVTVNFTLLSSLESWRMVEFGNSANVGDGADLNDFDKDGIVNLVEYAFALDPQENSAGQLPKPELIGNYWVLSFTAPVGVSGITYGAQRSTTLQAASWTAIPNTGSAPQHVFSTPRGTEKALFSRLKITRP